jgi:hypothetical protein
LTNFQFAGLGLSGKLKKRAGVKGLKGCRSGIIQALTQRCCET